MWPKGGHAKQENREHTRVLLPSIHHMDQMNQPTVGLVEAFNKFIMRKS